MDTFITEDGLQPEVSSILQTVFVSCDETNLGTVKVSKLMQFLKEKAITCEIFEFLDQLKKILDADEKDPSISWVECESGMQKWIWYINNKNMQQDFVLNVRPNSISTPRVDMKTNKYNSLSPCSRKPHLVDKKIPSIVSTYSNDSIDVSELSWDCGDIHSRIEDLEITNRNLIGENTKLKDQLNVTEDVNTSIIAENEDLQKQLTRFQKLIETNKNDAKRCNELKTSTLEYQNIVKELDMRISIFKKENENLQKLNDSYKNKISQMETNFDLLLEEKNKLNDDFVKEKVNKNDYLNKVITELSLNNEVLRVQKSTAERELSEIKQEVFHGYSALDIIPEELNCSSLLSNSSIINVKAGSKSLCQELKAEMCPCSSKDNLWIDDSFSGTGNRYTSIFLDFKNNFNTKKNIIIRQIEYFKNNKSILNVDDKVLDAMNNMENDLNLFMEKVSDLLKENLQLEKRLTIAKENMKSHEENIENMNESRERALIKLDNLSHISGENQEKLDKLRYEVDKERQMFDESIVENAKLKENYEDEIKDLHKKIQLLNENIDDNENLKIINEDLKARNLILNKRIFDVEDVVSVKDHALKKEMEKTIKIESALLKMKVEHESELKSILVSIPFVDNPCHLDGSEVTTEIILDNIRMFLEKSETSDMVEDEKYLQSEIILSELIDDESPPLNENKTSDNNLISSVECNDEKSVNESGNSKSKSSETNKFLFPGQNNFSFNKHNINTETGNDCQQSTPCVEPLMQSNLDTDIDPQLVENYRKFVISFQADQYTLPRRLENQQRLRDTAESSFYSELSNLRNLFHEIEHSLIGSYDLEYFYEKLHDQIEVIQKSEKKVSQQSEQQGCYQQEYRSTPNIDIVISYVDHLRKYISKMEEELDLTRENSHRKDTYPLCTDTIIPSFSDSIDISDNSVFIKTTETISHNVGSFGDEPMQFYPEKELKSVSFSHTTKKELYSPSDPVKKSSKLSRIILSPCRLMNKFFFFVLMIVIMFYVIWLSLEIDTKICDKVREYLPFDVTYSDLHKKK